MYLIYHVLLVDLSLIEKYFNWIINDFSISSTTAVWPIREHQGDCGCCCFDYETIGRFSGKNMNNLQSKNL